jgi:hypothetical protein
MQWPGHCMSHFRSLVRILVGAMFAYGKPF